MWVNVKQAHQFLKLVPADAKICASGSFLPHMAQRDFAYHFPYVKNADYIVALKKHDYFLITPEYYEGELKKYVNNVQWTAIAENESMVVLKKVDK